MFEWDETEGRWNAAHHPFTSPHEEDMDKLESDPGAVRALAYDVVLNGTELGSGSIRIHRQDIQSKIFKALGMSPEEQQARFGFFLEALQYGTPPHGGIALGLDRIVMILAGAESLREVIPFPKTAKAVDLMVDAPTPVSERQLKELGIAVVGKEGLIISDRRWISFCNFHIYGKACHTHNMKQESVRTTVDIPAPLYRKLKARAAAKGGSVRELVLTGVKNSSAGRPAPASKESLLPPHRFQGAESDVTNEQIYEHVEFP